MFHLLLAAVLLTSSAPTPSAQPSRAHHAVSTADGGAQAAFDLGLTLAYAYDREGARRAFADAARRDPALAMAEWGVAYALGPNMNVALTAEHLRLARAALARARAASGASAEERLYVAALAERYPVDAVEHHDAAARGFAEAMRSIAAAYPADADAAIVFAEAALEVGDAAWMSGHANDAAQEIEDTLDAVLASAPGSLGANHFLIHLLEDSGRPESALASADLLAAAPLDDRAAHLRHMASHVFLQTGAYDRVAEANRAATAMDERAAAADGSSPRTREYYLHELDFWGAAVLLGDRATDMPDLLARYARIGSSRGALLLANTARWDEILRLPRPATAGNAMWWAYARVLADCATGALPAARGDLALFETALHLRYKPADDGYTMRLDRMLRARIAEAAGDDPRAIALLERVIAANDLESAETFPAWNFPARAWLGAIELRRHAYGRAEAVFRAELSRLPRDARAQAGLAAALRGEERLAAASRSALGGG